MQAKDIPAAAFLDAIDEVKDLRDLGPYPIRGLGASRWDIAAILAGHPEDVADLDSRTRYDYPNMPEKVVLAKAKSLVRRGLVTGCACGCRGDFNRVAETAEERAS